MKELWHTTGIENVPLDKQILFYAGGSQFPYMGWNYPSKGWVGQDSCWSYDAVTKWCYVEDLLSLEKEVVELRKQIKGDTDAL